LLPPTPAAYDRGVPASERDRVVNRIASLEEANRHVSAPDVRATLVQAIEDCKKRLEQLDAEPRSATAERA